MPLLAAGVASFSIVSLPPRLSWYPDGALVTRSTSPSGLLGQGHRRYREGNPEHLTGGRDTTPAGMSATCTLRDILPGGSNFSPEGTILSRD